MNKATCLSDSEENTARIGRRLGELACSGDLFLLFGELGTGKTALIRGIAAGLDVSEHAFSPSFVLVREYEGRLPLFHMDFYRLEQPDEVNSLGLDEYLLGDGICAIEWAERAEGLLPFEHLAIHLYYRPERADDRTIHFYAHGPRHEALLRQIVLSGDAEWN